MQRLIAKPLTLALSPQAGRGDCRTAVRTECSALQRGSAARPISAIRCVVGAASRNVQAIGKAAGRRQARSTRRRQRLAPLLSRVGAWQGFVHRRTA